MHITSARAVVVTADDEGEVITVRAATGPGDALSFQIDGPPALSSREQILWAVNYAVAFAKSASHFCEQSRLTQTTHIEIRGQGEIHGTSHGLATLQLLVAHLLGAPARLNCVYSSALRPLEEGQGAIALAPIRGIEAKARAASLAGLDTIYAHLASEVAENRALERHRQGHYREEADRRCLPVRLRPHISWSSLINTGIDTAALWRLLLERGEASRLVNLGCYLLSSAMSNAAIPGEYPSGFGRAISALRSRVPWSVPAQLPVEEWLRACTAEHRADLIKLVISADPGCSLREDLSNWLAERYVSQGLEPKHVPAAWMPAILEAVEIEEVVEDDLRRSFSEVLRARIEDAVSNLADQQKSRAFCRLIVALQHSSSIEVSDLRELLRQLTEINPITEETQKLAREAERIITRKLVVPRSEPAALTITFEDEELAPDDLAFPGFVASVPRVNPLRATFTDDGGLNVRIPSPVLLMERAINLGTYSRVSGFERRTDTMSRIPEADAKAIGDTFGQATTRIQFRLAPSSGASPNTIGIDWNPANLAFPPAIDSQLFAAALQRWALTDAHRGEIHTLADIGCGSGFVSAIALHFYTGVDKVVLCDLREQTTVIAADNVSAAFQDAGRVENEPVAAPNRRSIRIEPRPGDFTRDRPDMRFDLVISDPPYLPEREAALGDGINPATSGTALLEHVVRYAPQLARFVWLSFSSLAWPEFSQALEACSNEVRRVRIRSRNLVPFRLTNVEPVDPREIPQEDRDRHPGYFEQRFEAAQYYYDSVLQPRGLIDLNTRERTDVAWERSAQRWASILRPRLQGASNPDLLTDESGVTAELLRERLNTLRDDPRGFRFWHEVRTVLIETD